MMRERSAKRACVLTTLRTVACMEAMRSVPLTMLSTRNTCCDSKSNAERISPNGEMFSGSNTRYDSEGFSVSTS